MIPVLQEDRTGCGIAAVATIAGVSYQEAKRVAASLGIVLPTTRLCGRKLPLSGLSWLDLEPPLLWGSSHFPPGRPFPILPFFRSNGGGGGTVPSGTGLSLSASAARRWSSIRRRGFGEISGQTSDGWRQSGLSR